MRKKKANTLIERFGFRDDDLKTNAHDDIMIWLDNNIFDILVPKINYNPLWEEKDIKYHYGRRVDYIIENTPIENTPYDFVKDDVIDCAKNMGLIKSIRPKIKFYNEWEYPITSQNNHGGNKYTVGFIDMVTYYKKSYLFVGLEEKEEKITFIPDSIKIGWDKSEYYYFEVKSHIKSLGELIRQIRFYQEYINYYHKGNWFIVSPDNKFEKQLKSQGIGFIKYT